MAQRISLALEPVMVQYLDEMAARNQMSRGDFIATLLYQAKCMDEELQHIREGVNNLETSTKAFMSRARLLQKAANGTMRKAS